MQTLFGLPIFGSLFTPILITIVSVLLFKTFFRISKGDINDENINIPPVKVKDTVEEQESTPKQKKKKKSCSGKKGGKGCCSTKNGTIDTTRVFIENSSHSKDLGKLLVDLWTKEDLNVTITPLNSSDIETQLLEEAAKVSLCVFLLDEKEEKPSLRPWLESSLKATPFNGELLSGLQYSVFVANGSTKDTSHLETDRALHRLGGVRVCKAGSLEFPSWLENLSNTVKKWNEGGKKGCKCGPEGSNENEGEHSSCSGSCSSSDDETAPMPVLDLEDLGKTLS